MAGSRLELPSDAIQTLPQNGAGSSPFKDNLAQLQSEVARFTQLRCRYMALQRLEGTRELYWQKVYQRGINESCKTLHIWRERVGDGRIDGPRRERYELPYKVDSLSDWAAAKGTYDEIASLYLDEITRLGKADTREKGRRIRGSLSEHADLLVMTLTKLSDNQLRDELAKYLVRDEFVPFLKAWNESAKMQFYQVLANCKALPHPYKVELAAKLGCSFPSAKDEDNSSLYAVYPHVIYDEIATMPEEKFFEYAKHFAAYNSRLLDDPKKNDIEREKSLRSAFNIMYVIEWRYQEIIHRMKSQQAIAVATSLPGILIPIIHHLSDNLNLTRSRSQAKQKDSSIFDRAPIEKYVTSFGHKPISLKDQYIEKLSAYIHERKHAAQIKKSEYLSRWGFFTRMSCTNKTNAAEKILALLEGKPLSSPFTKAELAALRDSRLGKIIGDCERDHLLPAAFQEAERNNTLLRYFRR